MMMAAATQHQCKVVDIGKAPNDEEETKRILNRAFSSGIHILITSGGVSTFHGRQDYIKPLLEKRGKVHFDKDERDIKRKASEELRRSKEHSKERDREGSRDRGHVF